MRAAPTQKPPIASAETPHLLPHLGPKTPSTTAAPSADPPSASLGVRPQMELFGGQTPRTGHVTEGARIARSARFGRVRVRTMRVRCGFYCLTKVRQIASRGGCDSPRLLWTEVITCHLRRPPVASALAAAHGIRRGLHAAPPAPAHAFGRRCASCCSFDLRRAPGRAPSPVAGSGAGGVVADDALRRTRDASPAAPAASSGAARTRRRSSGIGRRRRSRRSRRRTCTRTCRCAPPGSGGRSRSQHSQFGRSSSIGRR